MKHLLTSRHPKHIALRLSVLTIVIFASHLSPASAAPASPTLLSSLSSLSASERATLKGEVIAAIGSITKLYQDEYYLEITDTTAIPGGVEVFTRAWDEYTNPIGFGQDGTVDTSTPPGMAVVSVISR